MGIKERSWVRAAVKQNQPGHWEGEKKLYMTSKFLYGQLAGKFAGDTGRGEYLGDREASSCIIKCHESIQCYQFKKNNCNNDEKEYSQLRRYSSKLQL